MHDFLSMEWIRREGDEFKPPLTHRLLLLMLCQHCRWPWPPRSDAHVLASHYRLYNCQTETHYHIHTDNERVCVCVCVWFEVFMAVKFKSRGFLCHDAVWCSCKQLVTGAELGDPKLLRQCGARLRTGRLVFVCRQKNLHLILLGWLHPWGWDGRDMWHAWGRGV
jgi:hypothetical protein